MKLRHAILAFNMPDSSESTPAAFGAVSDAPQFSTAEYAHIPGSERCRVCSNLIPGEYYRLNGQMVCATCAAQMRAGQPVDSHAAFVRGLLLGIGAAIVGLVVYATFTIVTHLYIGYIALGVGWLVAKAIMKGSNGIGGRRYQIAAVLLTYAAISTAAIPIGLSYSIRQHRAAVHKPASENPFPEDSKPAQSSPAPSPRPPIHVGALLGQLILLGLASPFLELRDPFHGAIGLFILFIGLRIAWQITRAHALSVDGPYSASAA